MKRIAMTLVTVAGMYGQPEGVGSIVRADPALDKLIAPECGGGAVTNAVLRTRRTHVKYHMSQILGNSLAGINP